MSSDECRVERAEKNMNSKITGDVRWFLEAFYAVLRI